jgi:hypothetical protein
MCPSIIIAAISYYFLLLTGIVHFAGSTHGQPTSYLCNNPLHYPHFTQGAVPLFLSVLHSLNRKCPDVANMTRACYDAVDVIVSHEKQSNGTVKVLYNPGAGRFTWPPHRMGLLVNNSNNNNVQHVE